ncbi:RNA polymerase sigma factor [Tautonia rosea]|uniref:RNA polymerase sigma factor n=1 Tax=Tautonia rosea TaxID=2728037 RepID=UPI0019D06107|nr:sigma-70 family RNA polymerase sigma factor [Tautonia rosea]
MSSNPPETEPRGVAKVTSFETTSWSLVRLAANRSSTEGEEALAKLCRQYWYPVYAFIRRRGFGEDEAADLTQGFFARLLEKDTLRAADPEKGRFRTFLLVSCRNFLANEHDRKMAMKRGGGVLPLSLDLKDAEDRYRAEPSHDLTAERLFERRWALELISRSLQQLEEECKAAGRGPLFDALKPGLSGVDESVPASIVAASLGMTEAAVRKASQRLRQRFGQILRARIADTLHRPEDLEDEIRALFLALAS